MTEAPLTTSRQYAPVSGIIEEVNEELGNQPSLINKSPEDDGMLQPDQVKPLLINEKHIQPGFAKLSSLIQRRYGC